MKLTKYLYAVALGTLAAGFVGCQNAERHFPDYEGGTTVYFANQFPVRTIVLGNDEYDNSLDLAHKCAIYATQSGVYHGKKGVVLDIAVDNSLCNNLYFTDEAGMPAGAVLPMPSSYYSLSGSQISLTEMDNFMGAVEVQLTDAFFADPKAIENTYVIPLVITGQKGADHILTGVPSTEGATPSRVDLTSWSTLAKDYTLYCVRYINPWHSSYIRRGTDVVNEGGKTMTFERRSTLFGGAINAGDQNGGEGDEICEISTVNMAKALFPVSFKTSGESKYCNLTLTFNGDNCTVSCEDEGITATGSGEYITKGTAQPAYKGFVWGNKDRDILRLEYNVDFGDVKVSTKDTLVVRSRETNKKVTYTPAYTK